MKKFSKEIALCFKVAGFSFNTGLVYFLVISTLQVFLFEQHYPSKTIGLFAWVSFPYALKFLLSTFIEGLSIPFLDKKCGSRLGWITLMQSLMIFTVAFLSLILEKNISIIFIFIVCFFLTTFASLQDIALEAYRIESISHKYSQKKDFTEKQKKISSFSYMGFRAGMWFSGFFCLLMAHIFSWKVSLQLCALCMLIFFIVSFLMPADLIEKENIRQKQPLNFLLWREAFFELKRKELWIQVVLTIFAFKLADIFLRNMMSGFFIFLGYDKSVLATIDKFSGSLAVFLGSTAVSFLPKSFSIQKNLILWSVLQALGCLLFYLHVFIGPSLPYSFICVIANQFINGLGGTLLIVYFSQIALGSFVAPTYALLTSVGSLSRIVIASFSGYCAFLLEWPLFFGLAGILCFLSAAAFYLLFPKSL